MDGLNITTLSAWVAALGEGGSRRDLWRVQQDTERKRHLEQVWEAQATSESECWFTRPSLPSAWL